MPELFRIFLDANILFSASYKPNHEFLKFWNTPGLLAMTSFYAAQEAQRNGSKPGHAQRLEALLTQTIIVSDNPRPTIPAHISLPAKDQPILSAAINAGADFLITGDKDHFAPWMNQPIPTRHGVLFIMQPRSFLDMLREHI